MNKTISEAVEIQMELEQWLLSKIKKMSDAPYQSIKSFEKRDAFIEGYNCIITKRPIAMKHYQVCKNFRQL